MNKNIFDETAGKIFKGGNIKIKTPVSNLVDFLFSAMSDDDKIKGAKKILEAFHLNDNSFFSKYHFTIDLNEVPTLIITCSIRKIVVYTKLPDKREFESIPECKENVLFVLSGENPSDIENSKNKIFKENIFLEECFSKPMNNIFLAFKK